MIIKSLEIYGYGQFVQRKIEFSRQFTEIFGENEAGKSTIQAFIHSILFGFPTKKSKEPRLEPRLGNQYGGKLSLIFDDGIEAEVERIKGSAHGDVKIYLKDGTIRDEVWLNKKLNYISKKTYQGIFSFDVLGLQDIHKNLDEEQLQDYLLEAGALGSTEFTSMRDRIGQKKEELYKKSGKNPIINQQIEQLKQLENQIRNEESKLDTYHRLVDDKDKSSRRLENLKQNLNQLSKMHERKQKEVALHDQTQEWKRLEQSLNIEPINFPEKGIDRYETAKSHKQSLERDKSLREERLSLLNKEAESIKPVDQKYIDSFNSLYQQETEIKQKEFELRSIEKDIADKQRELEALQSNIGWQEVFYDTDSTEAMKSHMSDLVLGKQEQIAYINQLERGLEENKIEMEAQLFAVQLLFQYLFAQGRLQEARTYILKQKDDIQSHRVIRNLLAMCYLYLSEYEIAKELFETLLAEDNSDVHALCHYTLLLYNTNETEKYHKYIKILNKVMPMNEDESFKLGIVLSYLKQYKASQQLLLPLYKKGKFVSIQMFNALSYNYYYLGNKKQSKLFWDKLLQISEVDVGYAPWVLEESKYTFEQKILPLLLDDDSHYRLYGVFLLNQLNGKEILMTEDIWSVLENMNDYEKLYLTYLVQGLHLNKLDFIHKGLKKMYDVEELSFDTELFVSWIDKGEALIVEGVNFKELNRYIAAHVYLYYRYHKKRITKKKIIEIFNTTRYKLDNAIDKLLSI